MSVFDFESLLAHAGHNVSVVCYRKDGDPNEPVCNVAIECEDCGEVLLDYDNPAWANPAWANPDFDDVVFRVWNKDRHGDCNDVFALFPYIPATDRFVTSYQHVGQRSGAYYDGCIANSRPATPAEYADLLAELIDRGYNPRVITRVNRKRYLAAFVALV